LGQSIHGKTPKQRVVKKPMVKCPIGVMMAMQQDPCQAGLHVAHELLDQETFQAVSKI